MRAGEQAEVVELLDRLARPTQQLAAIGPVPVRRDRSGAGPAGSPRHRPAPCGTGGRATDGRSRRAGGRSEVRLNHLRLPTPVGGQSLDEGNEGGAGSAGTGHRRATTSVGAGLGRSRVSSLVADGATDRDAFEVLDREACLLEEGADLVRRPERVHDGRTAVAEGFGELIRINAQRAEDRRRPFPNGRGEGRRAGLGGVAGDASHRDDPAPGLSHERHRRTTSQRCSASTVRSNEWVPTTS